MASGTATNGMAPRWSLQLERGPGGERKMLWFGAHRIALSDILTLKADEIRERPVAGLIMGAIVFLLVSLILAFGVFEIGWRERFLLGTVFLAILGVAGLYDSTTIKAQRFFEVKIVTGTRGEVTFASADVGEVEAFLAALAGEGITS